MSGRPNPILKVILLGDSGVGKSSIINRYVKNLFVENNMQTIGVDLFTKVETVQNKLVTLQIWDTGGQALVLE
jgi:Ras-related protein Rab-7A